ncbi:caspase family protein [Pseudodesulfovibrio methanolicus]|uniref:Caspase family protein n=1 Tax=Pseudodesulfovibrio methanolicus TaxID=3126690 RepID=A0ABZ2J5Z1_9BACT
MLFAVIAILILSCCGGCSARGSYSAKQKVTDLTEEYNKKVAQRFATQSPQAAPSHAETTAVTQPAPVQTPQREVVTVAVKRRPNAIGVIIGNKDYARYNNGIPDVSYAQRDAQAVRDMFIYRLGIDKDNIIYVEDATQAALFAIFGTKKNYKGKLYNWVKPHQSEVFVYYSGHGAPSISGKNAYLVPVDSSTSYLAETGYPLDTLYANIAKLPSVDNVVIIDSCFSGDSPSGMLFKNVSPALLKEASHVERIQRSCVISSTSVGELSNWYPAKEHSLFTYYLLEAMSGKADTNNDHKITVAEIKKYVDGEVPYKARRLSGREQHPVFVVDNDNRVLVAPAK